MKMSKGLPKGDKPFGKKEEHLRRVKFFKKKQNGKELF